MRHHNFIQDLSFRLFSYLSLHCQISVLVPRCEGRWVLSPASALSHPMDHSLPDSSAHGILQGRILEWVAMPSSKGSSQPRDRAHISYISCIRQVGSLLPAPPGKPCNQGGMQSVLYFLVCSSSQYYPDAWFHWCQAVTSSSCHSPSRSGALSLDENQDLFPGSQRGEEYQASSWRLFGSAPLKLR